MLDSDLGDIFDQEKPKKVTGTIFTQTSDNCMHLQCIAGVHFNPVTEMRLHDKSLCADNNYYYKQKSMDENHIFLIIKE